MQASSGPLTSRTKAFAVKNKRYLFGLGAIAFFYFAGKAFEPTEEELAARNEDRIAQEQLQRLERDMERTGEYIPSASRRDSHFDYFYWTRFRDGDGIRQVQIADTDDNVVWEQTIHENAEEDDWGRDLNGHVQEVRLHVPRMQNGDYELPVIDVNSNSFTKTVHFEDKQVGASAGEESVR